jgi:hydrogenase maturation factor
MEDDGQDINLKSFESMGDQRGHMGYDVIVKGQTVKRKMTTGTFIKKYSVGKYLVVVRGHAFSIIDGNVVGNQEDAKMKKRVINHAFKVL